MFSVRWFALYLSCLTVATNPGLCATTNQCIPRLEGIRACESILGGENGGLWSKINRCCDGVRDLVSESCDCNAAIDAILGQGGTRISLYTLEPVCRAVQPFRWWRIPFQRRRNCAKAFEYGCDIPDDEIDAARFKSIALFDKLFAMERLTAPGCFDTEEFMDGLAQSLNEDAEVFVSYGIGSYKGLRHISEYLGMVYVALNHGFWVLNSSVLLSEKARLEISADGLTWTTGSTTAGGIFLDGDLPYSNIYSEAVWEFAGCQTKASHSTILAVEGLAFLADIYVQSAVYSKRYGIEDICRYHTAFCAASNVTRQYESEEECIEYMRSLPLYTETCGVNRPLVGHSVPCKFKHHFMIPADPELHCPHIGKLGVVDVNGAYKCDDDYECSEDEGQDQWPLLQYMNVNQMSATMEAIEKNNVGYEDETLGCAI